MNNLDASQNAQIAFPKHFFMLDVIRGIAALSIVLWHWQHFYYIETILSNAFTITRQPLYKYLCVFYTNGAFAVDLFFSLSGFIFFSFYAQKIFSRKISFKNFTIFRLSRLYPLHFLTLIAVLILQLVSFSYTGGYKVFPYNDLYHFILNIFFAQSWGLEGGNSFNSPSWSVSVEIFLYGLFFLVCYYKLNKKYVLILLMIAALSIQHAYSPLSRGIFSFFEGGLLYYFYTYLVTTKKAARYLNLIGIFCLVSIVIVVSDIYLGFIEHYGSLVLHQLLKHKSNADLLKIIEVINHFLLKALIFPSIILYFSLLETLKGSIGKKLSVIGNVSYSSYLLHFPLQLLIMNFCDRFKVNQFSLADSPITLLSFYVILVLISIVSFNYFEVPAQNYFRKKLIR